MFEEPMLCELKRQYDPQHGTLYLAVNATLRDGQAGILRKTAGSSGSANQRDEKIRL
jgi:hypothetical protein